MIKKVFFIFLFIVTFYKESSCEVLIKLPRFEDGPIPIDALKAAPRLTFLGTINGKSYYQEGTDRNWAASKSFCSSYGMQLAYFSSTSESDYISALIPSGYHWTAGVRIPRLSHFSWDTTGAPVSPNYSFSSDSEEVALAYWGLAGGGNPRELTEHNKSKMVNNLCVFVA